MVIFCVICIFFVQYHTVVLTSWGSALDLRSKVKRVAEYLCLATVVTNMLLIYSYVQLYCGIKGNGSTCIGGNSIKYFLSPSSVGVYAESSFFFWMANSYFLQMTPFQRTWCTGKLSELSHFYKKSITSRSVSIPFQAVMKIIFLFFRMMTGKTGNEKQQ